MVTNVRRWSLGIAIASMLLSAVSASANDAEGVVRLSNNENAGVIRISDRVKQASSIVRGQTPCVDDCCPIVPSYTSSSAHPPVAGAEAPPVDPGVQTPPSAHGPSAPGAYSPMPPSAVPPVAPPAVDPATEGAVEGVSYENHTQVNCLEQGSEQGYPQGGHYDQGYGQYYENCPTCQQGYSGRHCQKCYPPYTLGHCMNCGNNSKLAHFLNGQCAMYRARNRHSSRILEESIEASCQEKHEWFRCKFGYFVPTGCCGKGCPPIGHYNMVYPVDPNHFDQRDGQVYAAQGYGGPVSVPLAPVVNHTYNYGWGVPSSRLTPVSRPIGQ